jgi:hypothetical protein
MSPATYSQKWHEIAKEVDAIQDKLCKPVDPGIKEAVIIFNLIGFSTSGSCQGHEDWGCGPYVDITSPKLAEIFNKLRSTEDEKVISSLLASKNTILTELAQPIEKLIQDFYKEREVKPNVQIVAIKQGSWVRVTPRDADKIISTVDQKRVRRPVSSAEQHQLEQEFNDFISFLHHKFSHLIVEV